MFRIPLIKPFVDHEAKRAVVAVLESGYLTEGTVTRDLEMMVAAYTGAARCLAATSCTTGLELVLRGLGIGPGHEVIVPAYTYPASASVVRITGAMPVLVDVDRETMLIDWEKAAAAVTTRTRAIMPVSLFGNPVDYERLSAFCATHGIVGVEDAACALGASFKGTMTGKGAKAAVFSLHPRKFITTGEGGLVTTDDEALADWMDSYKHFGMGASPSRAGTVFERIGTNYKLSNILAALGRAQMFRVGELLDRRRKLARRYLEMLADIRDVEIPRTTPGGEHSYQSFCIFIRERDQIMAAMRAAGVEAQIGTYLLSDQPAFRNPTDCRIHGPMDGGRRALEECLALPLYHDMSEAEQAQVVEELVRAMRGQPVPSRPRERRGES